MRNVTHHAVLIGLGMLLVTTTVARCDEAGDSREQIIQGVRDDIHRKIQERNEAPAVTREEIATGGKQPATAPAHSDAKQEKPDTPK